MMFTTTNLFKGIVCPYANQCTLTNCIFSHERAGDQQTPQPAAEVDTTNATFWQSPNSAEEPAPKRRKIVYENLEDKPLSRADKIRSELAASRTTVSYTSESDSALRPSSGDVAARSGHSLSSLTRPVSPPHMNGSTATRTLQADGRSSNHNNASNSNARASKTDPEPKEGLNPRLVANDPAGHAKRSLFLKHLHAEMVRLNRQVSDAAKTQSRKAPGLSEQQLIAVALDEEERIAKEHPTVYANIIKQRIAAYRKMSIADWTKQAEAILQPKLVNGYTKPLKTGLTSEEELIILHHLVANQDGLEKFGYVTSPPSEEETAAAASAVAASHNFEVCDRCMARFQVFPDRSEEGLLTSNGPCRHHPNKKVFPHRTRGDVVSGLPKEPYYPCCNNIVGSAGCAVNEYHVFKTNSPARLAATLPFITTPDNDKPALDKHGQVVNAVTFDCEMGYTTHGLECIRLTAVSWPSAEQLVDVLVRPLGTIIDLNSRFSGVWPETFANAIPYSQDQAASSNGSATKDDPSTTPLPIVESPQKARELLCSFLTPKTPLIGHAIDNDLNTVRLCHPSIVDTVLLFPHPKGLPIRYALRTLTSNHLHRNIQTGGDRGHDSFEDAQATGDLVRFKIGEKWKILKSWGWRILDGELAGPAGEAKGQLVGNLLDRVFDGQAAGKKRKKKRTGSAEESTEDEMIPVGNGLASYLKRAAEHAADEPAEKS